jgi:hypothetical protein
LNQKSQARRVAKRQSGQHKQAATNSFCEEIEATTGDKVGMACSIFDVLANLEIISKYFKVLRIMSLSCQSDVVVILTLAI